MALRTMSTVSPMTGNSVSTDAFGIRFNIHVFPLPPLSLFLSPSPHSSLSFPYETCPRRFSAPNSIRARAVFSFTAMEEACIALMIR